MELSPIETYLDEGAGASDGKTKVYRLPVYLSETLK